MSLEQYKDRIEELSDILQIQMQALQVEVAKVAELEKELESSLYFNVDVIRCLSKIAWQHNHDEIPHYMNLAKQCIKSIELKNTLKDQDK